ncbi:MAG: alpha/beta fold hydrolase [Prochlorothrix sp.]
MPFTLTAQRHTLRLPQVSLSYLEWKQGNEPVLCLHGLADHGLVWADFAQHLGAPYHCIAPDLRGHGDSAKPPTGYYCDDMIGDLEGLLDFLGWSSAHVVSHSWGAKIAAIWATRSPDRFRSLVLVDPFFINAMPGWMQLSFPILYKTLPFLKMMGPFPSREAAQTTAQGLKQFRGWSALQAAVFEQAIEAKSGGQWGSKFTVPARNETFVDSMRMAGLTRSLDIPTLFIQPEQGLNRTDFQLQPYRTYLQKLQIQQVPGNHWPFLVEPAAFNQTVGAFLQAQFGS